MERIFHIDFNDTVGGVPKLKSVVSDGIGDNVATRRFFVNLGEEAIYLRRLFKEIKDGRKPPQVYENGNDYVSVYIEKDQVEIRNYLSDEPEAEKVVINFDEFYSLLTELIEERYLYYWRYATGQIYRGVNIAKENTAEEAKDHALDQVYDPGTGAVFPWRDTSEYQEWLKAVKSGET